ncbi:fibrinogen C domain-containing protein 1-like [Dysidea avara]|uniref:fibrinogen C domain-containing protein 1-like n=1 Tax=Dysidea avara TaxID=196820 RepID=UPI003326C6F5
MIITTVVTLLLLGVVVADNTCNYGHVVQGDCPIDNCCNLGYGRSTFNFILNQPDIYKIKNFCGNRLSVYKGYCDTVTNGGGWLVIQRRKDGSVDFNRDWIDYEDGFGRLIGEFWYGLHSIHCLTNQGQWELRIDYTFTNGTKGYLSYSNFRVGPAKEQYPLTITGYDGVTTDPTMPSGGQRSINNMKFTTRDRDNDKGRGTFNCAINWVGRSGGWWYNHCAYILPNHQYNHSNTILLNGQWHPLPFIEIKIRPKNCII